MHSLFFALRKYTRGIWFGLDDPHFKGVTIFICILIIIGTFTFSLLEHWKIVDAFYFSVATIVTVGYGDIAPKTDLGKLFAAFYMLVGVGTIFTYISLVAVQTKVSGHRSIFKKKLEEDDEVEHRSDNHISQ